MIYKYWLFQVLLFQVSLFINNLKFCHLLLTFFVCWIYISFDEKWPQCYTPLAVLTSNSFNVFIKKIMNHWTDLITNVFFISVMRPCISTVANKTSTNLFLILLHWKITILLHAIFKVYFYKIRLRNDITLVNLLSPFEETVSFSLLQLIILFANST